MFNLRLAFRTLFKTPFVTTIAALSLALGIGANTAIYSMFDQLLRRPLPVYKPEALVNLGAPPPKPGGTSCNQSGDCDVVFSYPMFRDLEKQQTALSSLAGMVFWAANVAVPGRTPVNGQMVLASGSYFSTLGLQPALGRFFTPKDDETIGANFLTVLSYGFWQDQMGGDPQAVGKTITVNGKQMTVIGVTPQEFVGTTIGSRPMVYVPLTMRAAMGAGSEKGMLRRTNYWVYVFGRLKPGTTIEQARTALNATYHPIINEVEASLQENMSAQTMEKFRKKSLTLEDGRTGQSDMKRDATPALILLFALTTIVLIIACANIANLLLARAANRELEMAVRLSLGGTRRQLLQQLLTESVLLAVIGGAVSLVVAQWTLGAVTQMLPSEAANTLNFALSWTAVFFAGGLSIVTGVAFGAFPALHSTRADLVTSMRNSSGKLSTGRKAARFRTTLATAQIALSMALLMSAGLFIKSLYNVSRADLGIKIDRIVTFGISPRLSGYDSTRAPGLFARVEQEMASLPGVDGITSSTVPLLANSNWGNDVSVQGFKRDPDTDAGSSFNEIGPDYFKTLGVHALAGREFSTADDANSPKVAIVNEAFAKKFGLGASAVGMRMARGDTNVLDIEIVGLVPNVKYSDVKKPVPPVFYMPYRQDRITGFLNFYVRTAGDPVSLLRAIPSTMKRIDPALPLEDLKTMPQQVRENVFLDRMLSKLTVSFAVIATLLAAIGLYGVLAYSVTQRTREIGVRMALGAESRDVRRMVLKQVGVMMLIGGAIGLAGAYGLGKAAKSLLYQIQAYDPWAVVGSIVVLTIVAMSAGIIPARRAAKVEPMAALRYE
jgi:predicted permease